MHVQFRSNIDSKKLPRALIGSYNIELIFFKSNERFFKIFKSSIEVYRTKRKFAHHHGHNILELDNLSIKTRLTTQVKHNVINRIANLLYELRHNIPNDLRLRILGSKEI